MVNKYSLHSARRKCHLPIFCKALILKVCTGAQNPLMGAARLGLADGNSLALACDKTSAG